MDVQRHGRIGLRKTIYFNNDCPSGPSCFQRYYYAQLQIFADCKTYSLSEATNRVQAGTLVYLVKWRAR